MRVFSFVCAYLAYIEAFFVVVVVAAVVFVALENVTPWGVPRAITNYIVSILLSNGNLYPASLYTLNGL